jgi:hypothetical protein
MPLYLDEIYFDVPGQDSFKNLYDLIGSALKDGLPPSATLSAWSRPNLQPFVSLKEATYRRGKRNDHAK